MFYTKRYTCLKDQLCQLFADGRNFHWTDVSVSHSGMLLSDDTHDALDTSMMILKKVQNIFRTYRPHELSFTMFDKYLIIFCIQLHNNNRTQILHWRSFSVAKILTFGFKALKHQPYCSCQEKHCPSCLRVEIICKCQRNKLHGSPFINDTLCFKSDAW